MGKAILDRLRSRKAAASPALPMRYEAQARLYEFEGQYFVCSVRWISETDSTTVIEADCGNEEVGTAILHHLGEYSPEEKDLSGVQQSDWPAYKASGARSIKAFERNLWHVDLAIMHSAVLVWARPRLTLTEHGLSTYAAANRNDPAKVGEALRSALCAARLLRANGGI